MAFCVNFQRPKETISVSDKPGAALQRHVGHLDQFGSDQIIWRYQLKKSVQCWCKYGKIKP